MALCFINWNEIGKDIHLVKTINYFHRHRTNIIICYDKSWWVIDRERRNTHKLINMIPGMYFNWDKCTFFIYVICICHRYLCSARFSWHTLFVSCNSNTMGSTSRAGTGYHSGPHDFTQVVCGVHVAHSIVFCVVFVLIKMCFSICI